jgi:putative membrane protein
VGGLLLMIGFWLLVIAVVVWVISRLFPRVDQRADGDSDLDQRLALGDIDPDTYRRLRGDLVGAGTSWNDR